MIQSTGLVYHNISSLKEGDEVCIEEKGTLGWTPLRHCKYHKKTVARITPAKRKVIMTDGTEYDHRQLFVYPCEYTERSHKITKMLCLLYTQIVRLVESSAMRLIDRMPDEKIEQICNLVNEAYTIYNTHERNLNK